MVLKSLQLKYHFCRETICLLGAGGGDIMGVRTNRHETKRHLRQSSPRQNCTGPSVTGQSVAGQSVTGQKLWEVNIFVRYL